MVSLLRPVCHLLLPLLLLVFGRGLFSISVFNRCDRGGWGRLPVDFVNYIDIFRTHAGFVAEIALDPTGTLAAVEGTT